MRKSAEAAYDRFNEEAFDEYYRRHNIVRRLAVLVLPRTFDTATGRYGKLYSNLLDYVISAGLIFYILTIAGVFRLRRTRPDVERPYKAFGYPIVPALYIVGASVVVLVLFLYRTSTTWPGLIIVLLGVPVFLVWRRREHIVGRA